MGNHQHLDTLRQGVRLWNRWRDNDSIYPDLSGADLNGKNLMGVEFFHVDLSRANLSDTKLSGANFIGADLSDANLSGADLRGADFSEAKLSFADLRGAIFKGTKFKGADLSEANFNGADLCGADLSGANLSQVNFAHSIMGGTVLNSVDLSTAEGLDRIRHVGYSILGLDTLSRSKGLIPEFFLRGCGVPNNLVLSLISEGEANNRGGAEEDVEAVGSEDVVILLGSLPGDSVTTSVKATNRRYITKLFRSTPSNWHQIADLINYYGARESTQILCHLTDSTLFRAISNETYGQAFSLIKEALLKTRHLILIYHENLAGEFDIYKSFFEEETDAKLRIQGEEEVEAMRLLISGLISDGFNILPYRTRVEFNTSAHTFLSESSSELVLRLYIPNERLWGSEIDHLLNLFRDYLVKISGLPITLNQSRTLHGTSYNFYSNDARFSKDECTKSFKDFSNFLNVCAQDTEQAAIILRQSNIPESAIRDIVHRYSRESRRITLDLEYSKRRAIDDIQYRLQSELLDVATSPQSETIVRQILVNAIPEVRNPAQLAALAQSPNLPTSASPQIVKIDNVENMQVIGAARGIIASVVDGDITYSEQDERLLDLIHSYAEGIEPIELQSALEELKDDSAPHPERLTSYQKLRMFLVRHKDKIEDLAFKGLTTYLEAKMNS